MNPPLLLSSASGVPFWRQIHDQLADRIRAGALASGEALPSVRALAAALAVSVITTKRAYDELVRDGLAEARQGLGTYVCEGGSKAGRTALVADLSRELADWLARARAAELGEAEIRALMDTVFGQ